MIERYALGCAFNTKHIFMNFPFKKLIFTCKLSKEYLNDIHRQIAVRRIFVECVKLIINDIIERNVTFWIPSKKANIHMKRFTGKSFKDLRKYGKWKNVDILKSMFSGYLLSLFMFGNRTPRVKNIYLSPENKQRIIDKTNQGFAYGDGKIDTTVKDYYELMFEKFPNIPKLDIKRIMIFGWKSVYLLNSYGGDIIIDFPSFWCYFGNLKRTALEHFNYYVKKLCIKIRILYRRKKIPWDGYYYFSRSENLYQLYLALKKKRGRPKKYFKFDNVMMYQIQDECKVQRHQSQYIFRIPYVTYVNYKFFIKELITDKAELVLKRNPLNFKDILISDNDYEFI